LNILSVADRTPGACLLLRLVYQKAEGPGRIKENKHGQDVPALYTMPDLTAKTLPWLVDRNSREIQAYGLQQCGADGRLLFRPQRRACVPSDAWLEAVRPWSISNQCCGGMRVGSAPTIPSESSVNFISGKYEHSGPPEIWTCLSTLSLGWGGRSWGQPCQDEKDPHSNTMIGNGRGGWAMLRDNCWVTMS
jgi:hypothetical protein